MMIIGDHTHHLIAVVAVRVLAVIVLTENLIVPAVNETETVRAGTGIVQAGIMTVTKISEIIIVMSVIAGTMITTSPGDQKKDETIEKIVKVAGTGALALVTGAEAGVEAEAGGAEAGAEVGAGGAEAGAEMSSGPVHSGMQIKRKQLPCRAT